MRKFVSVLLVAAVALLTAMPAQAQLFKWGVKAGVNMTKLDFDDYKDKMAGFFVGPMTEITIPVVGLGVDASLLFSQKGIKADHDRTKQYGLDIPINLKYKFSLPVVGSFMSPFVYAGPSFGFRVGDNFADQYKKKSFETAINVGIGLEFFSHLQIAGQYGWGLGKAMEFENDVLNSALNGKSRAWTVTAAYLF